MIRPVNGKLVVKEIEAEEKTKSGIILVDNSSKAEKSNLAKVVNVSSDLADTFKVGQEIIITDYAGTNIKHEDEKLLVISHLDVLAVLEEG